jgi:hypothetical protein
VKGSISPNAAWRKSSASGIGNCVQVAQEQGLVGLRDSKHPEGAVLVVSAAAFSGFVAGLKAGEFDPG